MNKYQVVLIVTDHSKFNYKLISKEAKFIFDSRNVIKDRTKKILQDLVNNVMKLTIVSIVLKF